MSAASPTLEQLQSWMQHVITHPLGIEAGVQSPAARDLIGSAAADVEGVVARSMALTSIERLAVYGDAYYARLIECMRELFPALLHALGEELFDQFTIEYLQAHPPSSYTLDHLADHFVPFLEATRPETGKDDEDWPDFIIDVARLERAIEEVFDGPGVEKEKLLSAEQLQAVSPSQWPDTRLRTVVCLRLLVFKFPVNDHYTEFREGRELELPEPQETFLALSRRNYVVRRLPLSKVQYVLLAALRRGETVGEAIAACAELCDDLDWLAGALQQWFRLWAAEEFFHDISLPASTLS